MAARVTVDPAPPSVTDTDDEPVSTRSADSVALVPRVT
jgi:hypothetical protein